MNAPYYFDLFSTFRISTNGNSYCHRVPFLQRSRQVNHTGPVKRQPLSKLFWKKSFFTHIFVSGRNIFRLGKNSPHPSMKCNWALGTSRNTRRGFLWWWEGRGGIEKKRQHLTKKVAKKGGRTCTGTAGWLFPVVHHGEAREPKLTPATPCSSTSKPWHWLIFSLSCSVGLEVPLRVCQVSPFFFFV